MKLLLFSFFFAFAVQTNAQNVTVSTGASTSGLTNEQYLLSTTHPNIDDYRIQVGHNYITFLENERVMADYLSYSVSEDSRFWSFLYGGQEYLEIVLVEAGGTILNQFATDIPYGNDDPSFKSYTLQNGQVVVRSDISFFTVYDVNGNNMRTINAVHGSPDGEGMADVIFSKDGSGLFFYNSRIQFGSDTGSRLLRYTEGLEPIVILEEQSRQIEDIKISDDGNAVLVHLVDGNGNHSARFIDANGKEMQHFDFDHTPDELTISSDESFLTSRASGRVVVYNLNNGERIGATSLRHRTIAAQYIPADNSIVILTGNHGNNQIQNAMVHVVNITERSISRGEVSGSFGWHGVSPMHIYPLRSSLYVISGASQNLVVRL